MWLKRRPRPQQGHLVEKEDCTQDPWKRRYESLRTGERAPFLEGAVPGCLPQLCVWGGAWVCYLDGEGRMRKRDRYALLQVFYSGFMDEETGETIFIWVWCHFQPSETLFLPSNNFLVPKVNFKLRVRRDLTNHSFKKWINTINMIQIQKNKIILLFSWHISHIFLLESLVLYCHCLFIWQQIYNDFSTERRIIQFFL